MEGGHETLGDNAIPSHYDLTLSPDTKRFTYNGEESVFVLIKKPSKTVLLNALDLKITSAAIVENRIAQMAVAKPKGNGVIEFAFGKPVKGEVELKIFFSGKIEQRLEGFYRSPYTYKGKTGYLLSTQFEAVDARRMFPCIDEPERKATFSLSLVVDSKYTCVSNMPIARQKKLPKGKKLVAFEKTPRMSTYLLYMGIGEYASLSGKYRNVKLRVLATPGKEKMLRLPMEYLKRYLEHHETYFGIKYPLPKMDLIGVPDFAVGAMENWGAITFRETALLGDENSSLSGKQRIATVIGHELAHQWFGNFVTMKWWNDLWLNESFATFIEGKATNTLFPEWKFKEQGLSDTKGLALNIDQSKFTHPISVNVETPDQIGSLFDRISYEKGASVLAMMEAYAGEEAFRKGLQTYLRSHAYANAEKGDLWRAIDKVSRKMGEASIFKVANRWTDTAGYPVLEATAKGANVTLTQHRFLLLDGVNERDTWPIPLTYSINGEAAGSVLLPGKSHRLALPDGAWICLNYQQPGFYRVSYDRTLLDRLGSAVKSGELGPSDIWGIENDLFAMVRTSRTTAADYADFIERYMMDVAYPTDVSILGDLLWIITVLGRLRGQRHATLLSRYAKKMLERLSWEKRPGEAPTDTALRSATIRALGMIGDEETIQKAREMTEGFLDGVSDLDPDIRNPVMLIAAKYGDPELYDRMMSLYLKEESPQWKVRYMQMLGAFGDTELTKKALAFALSKGVRAQDIVNLVTVPASINPEHVELVWEWTKANWQRFMKMFSAGNNMFQYFLKLLRISSTEEMKQDVETFFKDKRNRREDIEREISQTLEAMEANIRFINYNSAK